jgi:uncharacterized membrane protein YphA (DoxX/SURF4 family)
VDIALWVVQVILGFVFVRAGYSHGVAYERSRAGEMMWLNALTLTQARAIAVLETLGGIGLILPGLTRIQPWLTPTAAALLALLMVFAVIFHARRGETPNIAFTAILGILAAFVAYGRFVLEPF